jgi:hypothetical protein
MDLCSAWGKQKKYSCKTRIFHRDSCKFPKIFRLRILIDNPISLFCDARITTWPAQSFCWPTRQNQNQKKRPKTTSYLKLLKFKFSQPKSSTHIFQTTHLFIFVNFCFEFSELSIVFIVFFFFPTITTFSSLS